MGLTQTVAPTIEPVTVQQAKEHLRVTTNDDDAIIKSHIVVARQLVENEAGVQLINATYAYTLDAFPVRIDLPRPPLSSVTSIVYTDTAGSSQTLASSVYSVITDRGLGYIVEAYNQSWPDTQDIPNAVTVTYVAGYGATQGSVPQTLRAAILANVAAMYCGDTRAMTESDMKLNPAYARLLATEKVTRLA